MAKLALDKIPFSMYIIVSKLRRHKRENPFFTSPTGLSAATPPRVLGGTGLSAATPPLQMPPVKISKS